LVIRKRGEGARWSEREGRRKNRRGKEMRDKETKRYPHQQIIDVQPFLISAGV
jgi:hypothetical protein